MQNHADQPLESFLSRFGLTEFRPGQKEVIAAVLGGRDCLCVMPTGGGKSLCYQLPALVREGLTLVVSPLIALMKDQVDQLLALGLPVTFINSTLAMNEQYARLDAMAAGEYRLVYVVPERFRSSRFLEAVRASRLSLLAVDEAHCISEWGHDFRPDYARLGQFRRMLGNPTTIALTATATDAVRRDIVEQLDLRDPRTFITGFARPNLFYEIQSVRTDRQKHEVLLDFLRGAPGSGIVYASTRKKCEEVAETLAGAVRRSTAVYHAGLLPDQRHAAQDAFMSGRAEIVVATNAFGMGVDKRDVRFVVHYNMPGSLEAYYQEAGRAGRDGKPSRCLMLYNPADRFVQEFFIESAYPARENVEKVYDFLREIEADPIELTQQEIREELKLQIGNEGVGTCEQLLESAGALERLVSSQNLASVRLDSDLPTLVDLLPRQAAVRRKVLRAVEKLVGPRRNELVQFNPRDLLRELDVDQTSLAHALRELNQLKEFTYVPPFRGRAIRMIRRDAPFDELAIDFATLEQRKGAEYDKLRRVIHFALSPHCRQEQILSYFGDENSGRCGHCDNCRRMGVGAGQAPGKRPVGAAAGNAKDPAVLRAVRIVLSGVARTESRFPCGKNLIAQMLCGSASAKVEKLRLNQLSTFGLLKELKQTEVVDLIDLLVVLGCLEQVQLDAHRPVVRLTETGGEVMRGKADLPGDLPLPPELALKLGAGKRPPAEKPGGPEEAPAEADDDPALADPALLAALKTWRRRKTEETGLPAYMVLSNATLEAAAAQCPRTVAELENVKGIGPAKARKYGEEILRIVAATAGGPEAPGREEHAASPQSAPAPEESPAAPRHPHYWTWRLLERGFTVDECCAIRGLTRLEVLEHAVLAGREGCPFAAWRCLSPTVLRVYRRFASGPPAQPMEVLTSVPHGTLPQEVELLLLALQGPADKTDE